MLRSKDLHQGSPVFSPIGMMFCEGSFFFFFVCGTGRVSLCLVSAVGSAEMTEQFLKTEEAVGFQVPGVRLVAPILEFLHIFIYVYLYLYSPVFKERLRLLSNGIARDSFEWR